MHAAAPSATSSDLVRVAVTTILLVCAIDMAACLPLPWPAPALTILAAYSIVWLTANIRPGAIALHTEHCRMHTAAAVGVAVEAEAGLFTGCLAVLIVCYMPDQLLLMGKRRAVSDDGAVAESKRAATTCPHPLEALGQELSRDARAPSRALREPASNNAADGAQQAMRM